jgi:hypothetical protein
MIREIDIWAVAALMVKRYANENGAQKEVLVGQVGARASFASGANQSA